MPVIPVTGRRCALMLGGMMLTFMLFDVLWCAGTSFRAMSDPGTYINAAAVSVLLSLPFMLTGRVWVQTTVMSLIDMLLIANLMYCRTYFDAIPLSSYLLAGNLRDFGDSVISSVRISDLSLPLVTVVSTIMALRAPARPGTVGRRGLIRYSLFIIIPLAASAANAATRGGYRVHIDKLVSSCYYHTAPPVVYTLPGYLIYMASQSAPRYNDAIAGDISAWLGEHSRLVPRTALPDSITPRRNLVIIMCESLESWPIGLSVENQELTPYINSLIDRPGTLYAPNVVTQVDAGRSIDSQLLINAGMLPTINKVYSMLYADNRYMTLNQAVTAHGGRSYMLTPDKPVTWNTAPIAAAYGIDTLISHSAFTHDETIGSPAKLSDGSFMRQCVAKMRGGEVWPEGETAFVMFITYSGHFPFKIPDSLNTLDLSDRWPERLADYMRTCRYVDTQLRTLVDYIERRSDADDTMIVITGDHEGLAGDRAALTSEAPGRDIVSDECLTPLIILNSPVGGRHEPMMGQIDIYPTLLDLMRLDTWPWRGMGRSIIATDAPGWAITGHGRCVGDTLADTPAMRRHMHQARRISDLMITFDYMRRNPLTL